MIARYNRRQYSINIIFICTRKPKLSYDTLYCSGLEPYSQFLRGMPVNLSHSRCLSEGDFHFRLYLLMKGFSHSSSDFRHWCMNEESFGINCIGPRNHTELVTDFIEVYLLCLFRRLALNIALNKGSPRILNLT